MRAPKLLLSDHPRNQNLTADDFYHSFSSLSSENSDSSDGSHLHSTSRFRRLPTVHDTGSHSIQHQTSVPLPRSDSSRLSALETEIQSLKALKNGTAVVFCGLGFKSINDSNNWLLYLLRKLFLNLQPNIFFFIHTS